MIANDPIFMATLRPKNIEKPLKNRSQSQNADKIQKPSPTSLRQKYEIKAEKENFFLSKKDENSISSLQQLYTTMSTKRRWRKTAKNRERRTKIMKFSLPSRQWRGN